MRIVNKRADIQNIFLVSCTFYHLRGMELQKGRPENTDNRLDKEIRVYDFLDKLGVQYQRIDHEAAMTMEACEEIDHALGDNTTICKNLFLCNRQETDFFLLLMPGD